MKRIFVAGNWKSNKTWEEAKSWIDEFKVQSSKFKATENLKIVLCSPFTLLFPLKELINVHKLPLELGAQDVSPFGEGTYTGAVNAKQVKEFADWVLIGHSERRKHFGETEDVLQKKAIQAKAVGLKIIYCIQAENTPIPDGVDVVAYEPVWAISTGDPYATKPETPENANRVAEKIKQSSSGNLQVIYGGSTTPENVANYTSQSHLDGVLPGGASLSGTTFFELISHAINI